MIIKSEIWWKGPLWLGASTVEYPILHIDCSILPDLEKQVKTVTVCPINDNFIISRFSDFKKLKRCVALMLRFCRNCRVGKISRLTGAHTVDEQETSIVKLFIM